MHVFLWQLVAACSPFCHHPMQARLHHMLLRAGAAIIHLCCHLDCCFICLQPVDRAEAAMCRRGLLLLRRSAVSSRLAHP